jgi:hypothetical protein
MSEDALEALKAKAAEKDSVLTCMELQELLLDATTCPGPGYTFRGESLCWVEYHRRLMDESGELRRKLKEASRNWM